MEIPTFEQAVEEAKRRAEQTRRVMSIVRYTSNKTFRRRYRVFPAHQAIVWEADACPEERAEYLGKYSMSKGWMPSATEFTKIEDWLLANSGQWVFIRKVAKLLKVQVDTVRAVLHELKANNLATLVKRGKGMNTQWLISPSSQA